MSRGLMWNGVWQTIQKLISTYSYIFDTHPLHCLLCSTSGSNRNSSQYRFSMENCLFNFLQQEYRMQKLLPLWKRIKHSWNHCYRCQCKLFYTYQLFPAVKSMCIILYKWIKLGTAIWDDSTWKNVAEHAVKIIKPNKPSTFTFQCCITLCRPYNLTKQITRGKSCTRISHSLEETFTCTTQERLTWCTIDVHAYF